jgi:hypothetical protein
MDNVNLPTNVLLANIFTKIGLFLLAVTLTITLILVVSKKIHKESTTLTVMLGIIFATSFYFIFNLLASFLIGPFFKVFFK